MWYVILFIFSYAWGALICANLVYKVLCSKHNTYDSMTFIEFLQFVVKNLDNLYND